MYLSALEFLEEERDAWRHFEALDGLPDEALERPIAGAHGWSGRDLMGHLAGGIETSVAVARELAVGETSATLARSDAEWAAGGDAMNDRLLREWAALPLAEVALVARAAVARHREIKDDGAHDLRSAGSAAGVIV